MGVGKVLTFTQNRTFRQAANAVPMLSARTLIATTPF